VFGRYTAEAREAGSSRHFAPGRSGDTNRNGLALFPARNCDLSKRI